MLVNIKGFFDRGGGIKDSLKTITIALDVVNPCIEDVIMTLTDA